MDKPTLSIIVPVLLRGLRVRGNVNMQRKAAIVIDTMCKLVKDPEDIAPFASEVPPAPLPLPSRSLAPAPRPP